MLGRTLQLGRTRFEWLARRLSLAGVLSRRDAEKAIAAGLVTVDGETICQNIEVCSEATVCYKGALIPPPVSTPQLFGLVKPRRVLCVLERRDDVPTLHTLMHHLYVEQELLPDELSVCTGRQSRRNRSPPAESSESGQTPLKDGCQLATDSTRLQHLNTAALAEHAGRPVGCTASLEVASTAGLPRSRQHMPSTESSRMQDKVMPGRETVHAAQVTDEAPFGRPSGQYATLLEEFVDRRFRMSTRLQHDRQPVLAELPRHLVVIRTLPPDAEGLVLLTNDGDFAHAVQCPQNRVQSVFDIRVSGTLPSFRLWEDWRCGVTVAGFDFGPVWVHLVERPGMDIKLLLTSIGLEVRRTRRYAIGPYRLSAIPQHTVLPLKFDSAFARLLPAHRRLQYQAAAAAEARIRGGSKGAAAAEAAVARAASSAVSGELPEMDGTRQVMSPARRLAVFPAAGELQRLLRQSKEAGKEHAGGWCVFHEVKQRSALTLAQTRGQPQGLQQGESAACHSRQVEAQDRSSFPEEADNVTTTSDDDAPNTVDMLTGLDEKRTVEEELETKEAGPNRSAADVRSPGCVSASTTSTGRGARNSGKGSISASPSLSRAAEEGAGKNRGLLHAGDFRVCF
ncbi:pseudouridine synthase [Cystoisospora suis]|uniref:Pseudouridine synthase n=1 Tax=Cystoisospora suis TaxID=483139 RepID=A0A2C6KV65_9APIC|nr:pseudouridine synthase [Cystoisospora suis]